VNPDTRNPRFIVHQSAHQIGGNCIEIAYQGHRLILDAGSPLDGKLEDADSAPFFTLSWSLRPRLGREHSPLVNSTQAARRFGLHNLQDMDQWRDGAARETKIRGLSKRFMDSLSTGVLAPLRKRVFRRRSGFPLPDPSGGAIPIL